MQTYSYINCDQLVGFFFKFYEFLPIDTNIFYHIFNYLNIQNALLKNLDNFFSIFICYKHKIENIYRRDFPEITSIIQEEPQILKDHDDNLLPKSFEVDCVGI